MTLPKISGIKKFISILMLLSILGFIFFGHIGYAEDEVKKREEELSRTRGTIIGTVTNADTGQPLEGVSVYSQHMGDSTDEAGFYEVLYQKPGITELSAYRRDLIYFTTQVKVVAGKKVRLNFSMKKQQKACCKLEGKWAVTLIKNQTTVKGFIAFDRNTPDPRSIREKAKDDDTLDEFGTYDIDLTPLLGKNFAATHSTAIITCTGNNVLIEAAGYVYNINAVRINLIPRASHGGLSFDGEIDNDTIKGKWHKREYAPSKSGTFIMRRVVP